LISVDTSDNYGAYTISGAKRKHFQTSSAVDWTYNNYTKHLTCIHLLVHFAVKFKWQDINYQVNICATWDQMVILMPLKLKIWVIAY
jgi:hypothetical protein